MFTNMSRNVRNGCINYIYRSRKIHARHVEVVGNYGTVLNATKRKLNNESPQVSSVFVFAAVMWFEALSNNPRTLGALIRHDG